jgi:hypothetical protein
VATLTEIRPQGIPDQAPFARPDPSHWSLALWRTVDGWPRFVCLWATRPARGELAAVAERDKAIMVRIGADRISYEPPIVAHIGRRRLRR